MASIFHNRNKVSALSFHSIEEGNIDLDNQLGEEKFSDGNKSVLLSSSCSSPSLFLESWSQLDYFHLSDHKWFALWQWFFVSSVLYLSKRISFSGIIPIEDAQVKFQVSSEEQIIVPLLQKLTVVKDAESIDSTAICSERICSSCESSLPESNSDSFQILESERNSYLVSLVNLDKEDSELIPDEESEFDYFQSNFPSPSYRSNYNLVVKPTGSSFLSEAQDAQNHVALEELDQNEPVFWPLEQKIDWKSENWDCFCISPQRDLKSLPTPPNSTGFKLHTTQVSLSQELKRSLVFSSRSTALEIMGLRQRKEKVNVSRITTIPSRFNKSTENSAETVPLEIDKDIISGNGGKPSAENESLFTAGRSDEISIESVLGLGEFDGHEGIDSEFDSDVFSLKESLD